MEFGSLLKIFNKKGTNIYKYLPFANTLYMLYKLVVFNL